MEKMHDLLIFLYCCASTTPRPTPTKFYILVVRMVEIILGVKKGSSITYNEDALFMVSQFHLQFEPLSFEMDEVLTRFGSSGDVSSKVWGPSAWRLLHDLALGSKYGLVGSLLDVWRQLLPCEMCRLNLKEHLNVTTQFGSTQKETYNYTVALHNAVNVSLGKPCQKLSL
jgi:hypothetical protein